MDSVAAKLIELGVDYKEPATVYKIEYRIFNYFPYFYQNQYDVLETAKYLKMPNTIRALQKRLLTDYITERERDIDHLTRIGFGSYTLFGFGFHKNDKLIASRALLEVIQLDNNNQQSYAEIINTMPALQQGRLAKIANLSVLSVDWHRQQNGLDDIEEHCKLNHQI